MKIFFFFFAHTHTANFFSVVGSFAIPFCAICLLFFVCDFLHSILNCVNVYSFNFVDEKKDREKERQRGEKSERANARKNIEE